MAIGEGEVTTQLHMKIVYARLKNYLKSQCMYNFDSY